MNKAVLVSDVHMVHANTTYDMLCVVEVCLICSPEYIYMNSMGNRGGSGGVVPFATVTVFLRDIS